MDVLHRLVRIVVSNTSKLSNHWWVIHFWVNKYLQRSCIENAQPFVKICFSRLWMTNLLKFLPYTCQIVMYNTKIWKSIGGRPVDLLLCTIDESMTYGLETMQSIPARMKYNACMRLSDSWGFQIS